MPWWVILIIAALIALPIKIKVMKKMLTKKKNNNEEE